MAGAGAGTGAGAGAGGGSGMQRKVPHAVQLGRREENERLSFTSSSRVHETTIRSTHIYLDCDEYAVLEFDTLQRAYAIIVVLAERRTMSLTECRALGDALKLASRGAQMTNALFFSSCANFRDRYGHCEGPVVENDRLVCLIEPTGSHSHAHHAQGKSNDKMQVRHIELGFDSEHDLVLTAHTQCDSFTMVLALAGKSGALHVADCEALSVLLAVLEPGERIDLTEFLCHLAYAKESLGFIRLAKIRRVVTCILFASKARNMEDNPKQIESALKTRDRRLAAAQEEAAAAALAVAANVEDLLIPPKKPPPLGAPGLPMYPTPSIQPEQAPVPIPAHAVAAPPLQLVQTPPASPMPKCPYPDMVYTRALTESGQAQVYAGEKLSSKEKVAIKVFLGTGNSAGSTFRLELRMLLKMPEHTNVIEVLDFFEYPRPALVTRLIEGGGDMLEHIRKHGPIPHQEAKLIAAELADGVLHLHRSGIVHRDLKSANVLLKAKPNSTRLTPVIIDLGLGAARGRGKNNQGSQPLKPPTNQADLARTFAVVALEDCEKTQGMKGTPFWMCPEMVRNQEWSEKTDVYAFGIILWEMLSGKQPFSHVVVRDQWDLMWRILHGERPDISAIKNAPDELQAMVQRCWAQDPKERPTMQQVVDQLRGQDPESIFRSIDVDNSNSLDFAELVGFLGRYAPETSPGEMYPIFLGLDVNHSGAISLQEFIRFWNIVTCKGIHIALKECQSGAGLGR